MRAEYIDHYLTDQDVANFARQSFGKLAQNFSEEQNNSLIKFLARGMSSKDWEVLISDIMDKNITEGDARDLAVYLRSIPEHWVPFGHPHISLRMQAPVPIARQIFKHKIGYVESEESRRYVSHKPEYYVPDFFRSVADNVKQGSRDRHHNSDFWLIKYNHYCCDAISLYAAMIKDGVCPEQARFVLPQGTEVNWVWTGSLYAYANFYNQRSDSHAQKEIQTLAEEVDKIIAPLYPVSWAALTKGDY